MSWDSPHSRKLKMPQDKRSGSKWRRIDLVSRSLVLAEAETALPQVESGLKFEECGIRTHRENLYFKACTTA